MQRKQVRVVCVHFSDKCTLHVGPHIVEIHFDCTENELSKTNIHPSPLVF